MSKELDTIQKENNLNKIFTIDYADVTGINHEYMITLSSNNSNTMDNFCTIKFKKDSEHLGVDDSDLLEIVRDRLKCFQKGIYKCREYACAITHLEEALMWINKHRQDTKEKHIN